MNTTIDQLKTLLGADRLARLANMPIVKEGAGIEAHLAKACEGAAGPVHAMIKALRSAGSRLTPEDVAAVEEERKSLRALAQERLRAAEQQNSSAAEPQSGSSADAKAETKRSSKKPVAAEEKV